MDRILQDYGMDGRTLTWEQLAMEAGIEDVLWTYDSNLYGLSWMSKTSSLQKEMGLLKDNKPSS